MFARAIVLLMVLVVSRCREYKIGMLVQTECCHWTSMYRVGGAINIAMDHLREDQVIHDANFRYTYYSISCTPRVYTRMFVCLFACLFLLLYVPSQQLW